MGGKEISVSVHPRYGTSDHYLHQKGREYFRAVGHDRYGVLNGQIEAHKVRRLIRPTDTVLDFGCGSGGLLQSLQCARRIGVEINPIALQRSIEGGIECYTDLSDVPDGVADVIISNHALEHVPYPIEALKQIKSKLKPEGILALCVPIDDWRVHKHYKSDDPHHHLHTWTVQLLGNTLAEAGFSVHDGDISVLTHAWPKYYQFWYQRIPLPLFDLLCTGWAILTKRRQLFAVVRLR